MNQTIDPAIAKLIRTDFAAFVAFSFQDKHAESLGNQPYIALLCYVISGLISGKAKRLLVNLSPQHFKTFVCTVCLAAFLPGENPKLRLLIVAYGDAYAARLVDVDDLTLLEGYVAQQRHKQHRQGSLGTRQKSTAKQLTDSRRDD